MRRQVFPFGSRKTYKYVITLSRYQGKMLFSRHKKRSTWETQGGHIEQGESPEQAARRELYEESGALAYKLEPLCDFQGEDGEGTAAAQVFWADIHQLGALPPSEMAEVRTFDGLPENLTYPGITPVLYRQLLKRLGQEAVV